MSGLRITITARVRTRPDVTDADPLLALGIQALQHHPDIDEASYVHDRLRHLVWIDVRIARAWALDRAVIVARRALLEALATVGIDVSSTLASGPLPPLQLRVAGVRPSSRY